MARHPLGDAGQFGASQKAISATAVGRRFPLVRPADGVVPARAGCYCEVAVNVQVSLVTWLCGRLLPAIILKQT